MKAKIINILTHPPDYDCFLGRYRPEINWNIADGQWIGICGDEWPDLLGKTVLKLSSEFGYEVWQTDLRADKVYSHTFSNGLIHRLFPAEYKKTLYGFKFRNQIYSKAMLNELKKEPGNIILHLNGEILGFNKMIIENLKDISIPIVFSFHGQINLPSSMFFTETKNLPSKINHLFEHFWVKKNINTISYITYQDNKDLNYLNKIYKNKLEKLTMGCDFSFWHKLDKTICRQELNLPLNSFIIVTVTRFVDLKQVDKFIEILIKLSSKYDFLYLVIGYGNKQYENYLQKTAKPLLEKEKIVFPGYIKGGSLLKYLNSADLFVSTSCSEGGPVSVMEAFACELPVFSTKTGKTAELLAGEGAGCLVEIRDYKNWERKLEDILSNKLTPKILNRELARKYFDWPLIAEKFLQIYKSLQSMISKK